MTAQLAAMRTPSWQTAAGVLSAALLVGLPAAAGEFSVSPIRLDLGPSVRSGVIEVRNSSSEQQRFQIEAVEWLQDANGKDRYGPTRDLVFFPKIMSLQPDEEGVVRVGLRMPAAPVERTYRLFIEELPGKKAAPASGAQIEVLLRFGVGIFAAPSLPQDGLAIDAFEVTTGSIEVSAQNSGNRHHVVKSVEFRGTDAAGNPTYRLDVADRYLLAGTRKTYSASMSAEQCRGTATLAVEIRTERVSAARKIEITPAMCP
ncbi:fimbrial biogenesis chaperone [Ramlibacter sp.]|uniref:fimbrial biogenesis chaperone n=1 Tax=Ramlibacter sp. TaxID=1917967 RepID=UPI002C84E41D|nr:fimbria/pilus periplasmic chaperone [Ramlibacter sp.]HWI82599.1 fimbria/pilus periplasmic chaperone [Ramlibacter sp.]